MNERDYNRCIWTSSYDRGLIHLLDIWPEIIKEKPNATLHIFYGWNLFDAVYGTRGTQSNPERQAWQAKMNKKMEQPGVIHHGRVGQKELIVEIQKSGLWIYPTDFYEINCISALQAQAGGAIPVVINYAALKETVKYGVRIDGDIYDPEIKKKYTQAVIEMLDKKKQDAIRDEMMQWAKETYGWDKVAKQWDYLFREGELEEAKRILIAHDSSLQEYMPL